jgi:hypothetical protein
MSRERERKIASRLTGILPVDARRHDKLAAYRPIQGGCDCHGLPLRLRKIKKEARRGLWNQLKVRYPGRILDAFGFTN